MKITGLIWLEEIVEKLARKHRVQQDEVRELLANSPQFRFIEKGHRRGENVLANCMETERAAHGSDTVPSVGERLLPGY